MCRNAHDFFVVSDTLITFMACNINDKLMTVTDRFLKYVTFDTESSETTGVTPSTPGQRVFAEALVKELEEIGLEDITLDDKSYLMATLPANTAKEVPTIGFIAHLDTSPDMSGKDVEPRIVSYEGGDIVLCAEESVVLSPLMFPELDDYKGQDIIVTNGKTLLGADDKGGVAAIIAAMKYLKDHPEVEHGKIRVGFTPRRRDRSRSRLLRCRKVRLRMGLYDRRRTDRRVGIRELQCCRSQDRHQGCERSYRLCQGKDGECKPTGCGIPEHDS